MGGGQRVVLAGAIAALFFVALGLGWVSGYALNNPGEERRQSYRYAADKPFEIEPSAAGRASAQSFEYRTPCDNPKGQTESDLCAQWKAANAAENSAFWTKWGFWIGVIGSALLLWQIGLTREAVEDTSQATAAMVKSNELTEAAQRPWIRFEVEVTKVEVEADMGRITIGVTIHAINIGKSVAQSTSLWGTLCRHKTLNEHTIEMARQKVEGTSAYRTHIAPGDRETHWCEGDYDMADLHMIGEGDEQRALFLVFATARYFSAGSTEVKITERAFSITEGTKKDPFVPVGFRLPIDPEISADSTTVMPAGRTRIT